MRQGRGATRDGVRAFSVFGNGGLLSPARACRWDAAHVARLSRWSGCLTIFPPPPGQEMLATAEAISARVKAGEPEAWAELEKELVLEFEYTSWPILSDETASRLIQVGAL